jgi:hypothetical protein
MADLVSDVSGQLGLVRRRCVTPDFKDETRYALYVKQRSQISHIVANKCNTKRQMLNK